MDFERSFLQRRITALLLGLRKRLSETYTSYYPAEEPKKLITVFLHLISFIENNLDNYDQRKLRWLPRLLEHFECYLSDLHYANSEDTPRVLVLILKEIAEQLSQDVVLIAAPQKNEFNYVIEDIIPDLRGKLEYLPAKTSLEKLDAYFPERLDILRFPRIEKDNVFSYPIFTHEFGHRISEKYIHVYESEEREQTRTKKFIDKVKAEISRDSSTTDKEAVDKLLNVWKRGLEELIADFVGMYVMGPALLFSFYDWNSSDDLDLAPEEIYDYYPPQRFRLRLMKNILDEECYTKSLLDLHTVCGDMGQSIKDSIKSFITNIEEVVQKNFDAQILDESDEERIAYEWIDEILPSMKEFARQEVGSFVYDTNKMFEEVPCLLERLAAGVLPNETNIFPNYQPADWRSIIIAGCIYKLTDLDVPISSSNGPEETIDRVQRLTLKAVESVLFDRKYSKSKSN